MRRPGGDFLRDRQGDQHPGSASTRGGALRLDAAAHRLDEAPGDRQAEPDAGLASVRPSALIEFLEDPFEIAGFMPGPSSVTVISTSLPTLRACTMTGTAAAVFLRIVEQIEQHLLDEPGVAFDKRQVARQILRKTLLRKGLARPLYRPADRFRRVDEIAPSASGRPRRSSTCRADWR